MFGGEIERFRSGSKNTKAVEIQPINLSHPRSSFFGREHKKTAILSYRKRPYRDRTRDRSSAFGFNIHQLKALSRVYCKVRGDFAFTTASKQNR